MLCKLFLSLALLLILLKSQAQDSPQDYLNAHNQARAEVGVGSLTWDNKVAAYAQNYANQRIGDCKLAHSGGPYGENLAWSSGDLSAIDAVKLWVDEKFYYDYKSDSCAPGNICGHYTQVVWRDSIRLGCAKVTCNNGGTFIGCNYDPAQDKSKDYLNAHNQARAEVGNGVGLLTWDDNVAAYAKNYTNQRIGDCKLVHSGGPYGENLAWSSSGLSAIDAVNLWVDEKIYYYYNSNSCATGQTCGHYTQVVWRDSVRLGCAKVTCNNGGTFIGCNYDPPGNYVGQMPY